MTAKIKEEKFDLVGNIMAYEADELDDRGMLTLFAHLITSGQAWSLQGHYGRVATALLDKQLVIKNPQGVYVPDFDKLEQLTQKK